ncbi:helix-turn-helix domain-containing protein [Shewanella sp.]|uniref:helix-turn-helix domain-containing protein n=1 Tax=Shewanella sp. TaxID=50422 RepID=UPI003D124341
MDISLVAKRSGVPASTLRYYEERGLIRSLGRHGIRRQFGAEVLERLALIALGRSAGLSLDEIGSMLGTGGDPLINRELLLRRAEELESTILRMQAMRDGLRHAANCTAPSHMECPKFRRLMKAAAAGVFDPQGKPPLPRI